MIRVLAIAAALCAASLVSSQEYTLVDLGPVRGDVLGAMAVNNAGQVVGVLATSDANEPLAFIWSQGTGVQLLGPADSGASAINESGQVVGNGSMPNGNDAFLWTQVGGARDLGNLGGESAARSINEAGHIVGGSFLSGFGEHSFIWTQQGAMQDLNLAANFSTAIGINDNDQVVGVADGHAYLWTSANGLVNLGALGGVYSAAYAINNSAQVVGNADDVNWNHVPFLWTATGGMINLGTLGGTNGNAEAINATGVVVGFSENAAGDSRAFVWTASTGMRDLNTLVNTGGMVLTSANGINDNGEIVGRGMIGTEAHAFALISSQRAISGTVGLQNYSGAVAGVSVTLEIRNPGTTSALESHVVALDSAGRFQFATSLHPGSYDIAVKASHWLRSTHTNQTITASGLSGLSYTLANGDVNGDNAVTLGDFAQLKAAFGTSSANADLNGDGAVTLADFAILRANFGMQGDP